MQTLLTKQIAFKLTRIFVYQGEKRGQVQFVKIGWENKMPFKIYLPLTVTAEKLEKRSFSPK